MNSSPHIARSTNPNGTIRSAANDDLPRATELLREHGMSVPHDLDRPRPGRHVLVLDSGRELLAVAVLQMAAGHGHLIALAMAHADRALEDRMIGVAEALCDAFGADLDIGARAA